MKQVALPLLLICALSACGKSEAPSASAPQSGSDPEPQVAAENPKPIVTNVPLDRYVEVADSSEDMKPQQGFDLVALNAAVSQVDSALPVDFEVLANSTSKEYFKTQDAFKKKELLATLKPKLEERIGYFQANPYIATVYNYSNNIEAYDFNRGGFPVNVFKGNRFLYAGDTGYGNSGLMYGFNVKNEAEATFFPVSNEELAKRIETMRTSGETPRLKAYFTAETKPKSNNATAFHHYFTAEIPLTVTALQLIGRDGTVLATYVPGAEGAPAKPSQVPANAASIANDL